MEKSTDSTVREKLVTTGTSSLSETELVSILLKEGSGSRSALRLAEELMGRFHGSLEELSRADLPLLRMSAGIGLKKASTLAAAFEIANRLLTSQKPKLPIILNKDDVAELMGPVLCKLPHEEMWVLYLSAGNGVIECRKVSQGGVNQILVDQKLVLKRGIELLATSIIMVHNHPSGFAEPSPEDRMITYKIREAAALVDIALSDHVIIADNNCYSFRQNGLLE